MQGYFYGRFQSQLSSLEFKQPKKFERDFKGDDALIFFGGRDWANVGKDLLRIPTQDRARFVLSLFMIVLTDQCLYARWNDAYAVWRRKTSYPKFGWIGFGSNNENPLKILWAPERENMVSVDTVLALMPEFVKFMKQELAGFFTTHIAQVNTPDFLDSIKRDYALTFDEGKIVKGFKKELEVQTR